MKAGEERGQRNEERNPEVDRTGYLEPVSSLDDNHLRARGPTSCLLIGNRESPLP